MRADERELFARWMEAFGRYHEAPATLRPFAPEPVAPGAPGDLFTFTVKNAFARPEMLGHFGHFKHMPKMQRHARRMGFDWDESGMIVTMPTPSSYNVLADAIVGPDAGFRTVFYEADSVTMRLAEWLRRYNQGFLPIHVATTAYYESLATQNPRPVRELLEFMLHDLGVHTLNYHLVPRASIADLARRIHEALPDRAATWEQPNASAPITLTYFWDNDFNRYCYAVWCRTEAPEDFARVFTAERNYAQLLDALAVRIDETRAGKGDVASEDADHMAPLAPVKFDVP